MESNPLPPLYLITNRHQTNNRPLITVLHEALQAGVRLIQLREKDLDTHHLLNLATEVLTICRFYNALLLINDRVDLVKVLGADGVHLRVNSLPIPVAKEILGPHTLIGVSAHTPAEVIAAEAQGANFIVFGPVYDTPSKRGFGPPLGLQVLEQVHGMCHIPLFAIGGLTPERVAEVRNAGAYGVAVISSILESEKVSHSTRQFLTALNRQEDS
jgi:thiamine-phosphate pyrophosphorylase